LHTIRNEARCSNPQTNPRSKMRTSGTNTFKYIAIARPSGRLPPRDTELYGRFTNMGEAEYEQEVGGGRIVNVTETTTWKLATPPAEPQYLDRPDAPGRWWRWCNIFNQWEDLWVAFPIQASIGIWSRVTPPPAPKEGQA